MPTVFKAKRLEDQAEDQETSTEAARASRAILDRISRVSNTYDQIEGAFSHVSAKEKDSLKRASDNIRNMLERFNSDEMRQKIAQRASEQISGARLMYETGQREFQDSIDKRLSNAERHIKRSDKALEKVEEALDAIDSAAEAYSKRQHGFRARQILDSWADRHPGIARKIGALSPEGKVEYANSIIDNMDFFILQKHYIELKVDQLVLERLGSASSEISKKQFANAKQILEEGTAEIFIRELEEKRNLYYVEPDAKSNKAKAAEGKPQEEGNDFKQKPSQKAEITLDDFIKDVKSDSRTVTSSWRKQARQYYKNLSEWRGEKSDKIEALLDKLDEDRSMQTAIQLWKEIHAKWIEKSSVLDDNTRERLMLATLSADDASKATYISRESLGLYVMNYKYELLGYGLGKASFKDKNEAAVAREDGLINMLKAKEQMYRELEEAEKKKDKESFKRLLEEIEKTEKEINKLLHNKQSILDRMMGRQSPVLLHPSKLKKDALNGPVPTRLFLGYYDHLESIMYSRDEERFNGEYFMWAYWQAIAQTSYNNYKLNQAEFAGGGARAGTKSKSDLELYPLEAPRESTKQQFEPPPMPPPLAETQTQKEQEELNKSAESTQPKVAIKGDETTAESDEAKSFRFLLNKGRLEEAYNNLELYEKESKDRNAAIAKRAQDIISELERISLERVGHLVETGWILQAAEIINRFSIPKEYLAEFKDYAIIEARNIRDGKGPRRVILGDLRRENAVATISSAFGITSEELEA